MRRTDGGRLNHVADGESLDRLVLGSASRAVGATDGLDVAATLLVTAVGRSLLDHVGLILSNDVSGCLGERGTECVLKMWNLKVSSGVLS